MANFEAFRRVISSSINLLFLKSVVSHRALLRLIMFFFPYSGSIAPIVGTGVNIGHGDGINPEVGSNIVFQNDEIDYQINGGANFGTLENILGNLGNFGNIGQGIFGGR